MQQEKISILFPIGENITYKELPATTLHDLGLDDVITKVTSVKKEQDMMTRVLSTMYADPNVTRCRCEVFKDMLDSPNLRNSMLEILGKIDFLKDYGTFKSYYEGSDSIWDLMHRLDEIRDYISYVQALYDCLGKANVNSKWLNDLRTFISGIHDDNGFSQLSDDISQLSTTTQCLRSVTLGINLNERFEAREIGLVSVNDKPFVKSGALGRFSDFVTGKKEIQEGNSWNGNMRFQSFGPDDRLTKKEESMLATAKMNDAFSGGFPAATMAMVPENDSAAEITSYMDKVAGHTLSMIVKKLKQVLSKYVTITISDVTRIIPELVFYVRWAEYFESLQRKGLVFCIPEVTDTKHFMQARGIYNLKLTSVVTEQHGEIVTNDIDFNDDNLAYILTGANRGGKTTITQAVGQLFVLAQAGLMVPATSFRFTPADTVRTHFPADEDKTLDLGRLGEECSRFKEMYSDCTGDSLLLLNETFSTTSFEEGYYIACDSVKAILAKGVRTIYNTHMHKLGFEAQQLSEPYSCKAKSLIVVTEEGKRSFKVRVAEPEGSSLAHDIAVKYGVTYDMLTSES